jgi:hypothetical protein
MRVLIFERVNYFLKGGIYERKTVLEKPAVLIKFRALLSNYTARMRSTYASAYSPTYASFPMP